MSLDGIDEMESSRAARRRSTPKPRKPKKDAEEVFGAPAAPPQAVDAESSTAPVVIDQDGQVERPRDVESDRMGLHDLPEPEVVADRQGDLDADELELLGRCRRAFDQYADAEAVAIKAMLNIRDRRLYRATHRTFEAFVQDEYRRKRTWVNRQIGRYLVTEAVGLDPIGSKLLDESQTRELTGLLSQKGPDAVREVWEQATKVRDRPTARIIRQVRDQRYPRPSGDHRVTVDHEVALVRKLGATPIEIAQTLRAGLDEAALIELAELLIDDQ
jgi:hypothetical protein